MPWQAYLYVGVRVHNDDEVRQVFASLPGEAKLETDGDQRRRGLWGEVNVEARPSDNDIAQGVLHGQSITFRGKVCPVTIEFMREQEGGSRWPVVPERDPFPDPDFTEEDHHRSQMDYTDAIVGFPLTGRYRGRILDDGYRGGAPEPFVIEPEALLEVLAQVRPWWPEAQILMWTTHF